MVLPSHELEERVRAPAAAGVLLRNLPILDPRTKRDLLGRRLTREAYGHVRRVVVLLTADVAAALAALRLVEAAFPGTPIARGAGIEVLPFFLVLVVLGQACLHTYAPGRFRKDAERLLIGVLVAAVALLLVDAAHPEWSVRTPAFALAVLLAGLLVVAGRAAVAWAVRLAYRRGYACKRTLVIGGEDDVEELRHRIAEAGQSDIAVVGFVSSDGRRSPGSLGSPEEIATLVEEHSINNVIVSGQLPQETLRFVVQECFLHGAAISLVPATLGSLPCRLTGGEILGWPLITLDVPGLHLLQMAVKRAVDLVGAAIGLLVLSPLLLAIALLVRFDSPGPVLFRQWRPGLGGGVFGMLKFRTMRADAEEVLKADEALYRRFIENDCKLPPEEDLRISRVGAFLRRTSLDELPQLINVLVGDMSLVGPRPVVGPELEHYGDSVLRFLSVRPGITGYWQVNGRASVAYPQRADLDLFYIGQWSLWMDLRILAMTIPSVIRRHGAH